MDHHSTSTNQESAGTRFAGRRVLYERFINLQNAAFWAIDQGMINGLRSIGCEVTEWFDDGHTSIADLLADAAPNLFLGCLQRTDRSPANWLRPTGLDAIERQRCERGMRVAVRSSPSDMPDYVESMGIAFEQFRDKGVSGFYLQPARPNEAEQAAFDCGLIDLIRSPLHTECYPVCFRSYLEHGLGVLEEPHAGDAARYHRPPPREYEWDVLYIGSCWAFKWENMGGYIKALSARFGPRFALFGSGWPEHIQTNGVLPFSHVSNTQQPTADSHLIEAVSKSKVCISLHEPTQVMPTPFAGNERVYKLMLCGAAVVSDPNPMLAHYFNPGRDLLIAHGPDEMVRMVDELVVDVQRRQALASAGRAACMAHHTYTHRALRLMEVLEAGVSPGVIYPYTSNSGLPTKSIEASLPISRPACRQ